MDTPTPPLTDCIDAYLYSRVSTKIQLSGLGIERQDNGTTRFLAENPR